MVKYPIKTKCILKARIWAINATLLVGLSASTALLASAAENKPLVSFSAKQISKAKHIGILSLDYRVNQTDTVADVCSKFKMTATQVQLYFKKALPITGEDFHHSVDTYPCFVFGKAKMGNVTFSWEISSSGGAMVWSDDKPSDKQAQYLVCDDRTRCGKIVFVKNHIKGYMPTGKSE
jgi:hypothetical protein